jgi:hypothetical protein
MFLRFTSRTIADGSVARYVALAHNRRVDGQIKPDVLMNLGRVDQLGVAGLRRLAASINRHFGDADAHDMGGEPGVAAGAAPLEVIDARPVGATWLLDGLWRRLEVAAAIRASTDARRFTTNMERVLFALVANRAIASMSKRRERATHVDTAQRLVDGDESDRLPGRQHQDDHDQVADDVRGQQRDLQCPVGAGLHR